MDFIMDGFVEARRFRCLTMVDEYTRECPVIEVDVSLPSRRVVEVLGRLAATRGLPQSLIVDHGPEFISKALDTWAYRHGVQLVFIRPGKPVDNTLSWALSGRRSCGAPVAVPLLFGAARCRFSNAELRHRRSEVPENPAT
jgi:putative transposase